MSALVEIQKRIESTGALIAQYESAIARDPASAPPSLYANIRALEKLVRRLDAEFLSVTQEMGMEVYRYRLLNESPPTLAGVADAWAKFQALFGSVYTAIKKQGGKKGRKAPEVQIPEFGYGYTFSSSIGVVMTLPGEATNLIGDSPLIDASDTVFDLIEAKRVNIIARELGPAPIRALHELIEVHSRNRFGLGLEWRYRGEVKRHVEVEYGELADLSTTIADTVTTSTTTISGDLFEVNTEEKTFKIRADDGTVIEGTYEDAIGPEHEASLPARYTATILRTTKIVILGTEPATAISLEKLERIVG